MAPCWNTHHYETKRTELKIVKINQEDKLDLSGFSSGSPS